MAGVYIPGMKMPSCCDRCIYSGWSNFYQVYICTARWQADEDEALLFDHKHTNSVATMRSGRADNCPLLPVPDHGDLIDRDKLMGEKLPNNRVYYGDERISYQPTVWQIVDSISKAPTIIPADKGDDA